MISRELFLEQDKRFKDSILPPGVRTVIAEAGSTCCWEGLASGMDDAFGINRFGISGPGDKVAEHLRYTPEGLAELIERKTG
jgi:transketolase